MTFQRPSNRSGAQVSGIAMLILGILHVPLPQADYHNIRHHDGAGEICPHHDHLLRWHPLAGGEKDVAVLHWHWVLPRAESSGERSDTGLGWPHPVSSPRLHAFFADYLAFDWSGTPAVRPAPMGRSFLDPPSSTSALHVAASVRPAAWLTPSSVLALGLRSCSQATPRAGLLGLFQQRNC